MRFVLQTVKAQPTAQAKPAPTAATATVIPQPSIRLSNTAIKQPFITSTLIPTSTLSTATSKQAQLSLSSPATTALPTPAQYESKEAVEEVRLRFDTTYSENADSSRREEDDDDEDGFSDDEQDEGSEEEEEEEEEEDGVLGAPSVAINCSFSINPTSVLQRSMYEDNGPAIEEAEDEAEEEDDEEQDEAEDEMDDERYLEEEKQCDEDEQLQQEEVQDSDVEEEEESKLRHFVAVDESLTHLVHSTVAGAESTINDSEDENDDLLLDDDAFQLHAFQPHTIHIKPLPLYEEEKEEDDVAAAKNAAADEEEAEDAYENEDGVSELCTVHMHQHSLLTQAHYSQSHWNAIDTPTRPRQPHHSPYKHGSPNNSNHYATTTPTHSSHRSEQTASFTLNDSSEDIHGTPPPRPQPSTPSGRVEWNEAAHEARVAALQVELKERVEARRRKLRRASYMEEMEEKRLQKELDAKQRALQQLRLLRVKQEAEAQLAALAAHKQQQAAEEQRALKERTDKENKQQQPPQPQPQLAQKRRSTSQNNQTLTTQQPTHTRTPSSLVMRKRIKAAHYDRLLKAVERGDTFTKYYDSWYCKPKPKFVRVVCLYSPAGGGASSSQSAGGGSESAVMKLTWGSDMFNMDKSLDLSAIVKVQRGSECAVAAKLPVELHARAFSVTTADNRTLHLVAPTQATREVWLSFVLLMLERRRQPLVELGEVKVVAAAEEVKVGAGGGGGMGARVRKSMGARLSLRRLSLGGKAAVNNAATTVVS